MDKDRHTEDFAYPSWNHFIKIARWILPAPGVVVPIDDRQSGLFLAGQEDRTVIAAPWFIGRNAMKGQAVERQARQHFARFRFVNAVADIEADWL